MKKYIWQFCKTKLDTQLFCCNLPRYYVVSYCKFQNTDTGAKEVKYNFDKCTFQNLTPTEIEQQIGSKLLWVIT
jgi:hypothetical protein